MLLLAGFRTDPQRLWAVIIVDEAAVRAFWPNQDPIGRRVAFEFGGRTVADPQPVWREVVGVVRTVRL